MFPGIVCKLGVEADAEVIVKRIGSCELAVAGFAIGRVGRRALPCVFHEIEVGYNRVDIALAKLGEVIC